MTPVLDASAVLALFYREPGHELVSEALAGSVMSSVSLSEVIQKLAQRGQPDAVAATDGIRSLGIRIEPFTSQDAARAGLLWQQTRHIGLSLGGRACLAVTERTPDGEAVTADQAWDKLDLGIAIRLIR
ncbi:PIN domain-containing protein [Pseudonocardia eucalypti]|uniref:PIN domain-containing protein n=1 Tax=Pseudonocardia eucalypti TaxID=648755 RepID=A0ABP9RAQ3_9PSEU|nr:PIN domain nuclease of toxin-antitoxin system [Pseudonocardia eucalypti]